MTDPRETSPTSRTILFHFEVFAGGINGQDHRIITRGIIPAIFSHLWTAIGQGRVWHGKLKTKPRTALSTGGHHHRAFLNEEGKPRQYVAIRADITERKAAEIENSPVEYRVWRRGLRDEPLNGSRNKEWKRLVIPFRTNLRPRCAQ